MVIGDAPVEEVDDLVKRPLTWFAVLERARAQGDVGTIQLALRQLRKLGVKVTYQPQPIAGIGGAR